MQVHGKLAHTCTARQPSCSQYMLWRLSCARDVVQSSGGVSKPDISVDPVEARLRLQALLFDGRANRLDASFYR
jgi:hypothetical protein